MHKRILIRARKGPFEAHPPEEVLERDLIGQNSGNLVFSHAAFKILQTSQTTITPNRFSFDALYAHRVNEEYDVFVIPLANAFRRSYHDRMVQLTSFIERLKIPVMVFGVGAQTDIHANRLRLKPLDEMVKRFTAAVLDRSPSIGVRGEITADYLRDLGFRDVDVIGCPSMFMNGDSLHVAKACALDTDDPVTITISPYVKTMGPIVESHHRRYPNLTYIAQDIKSLDTMLWGDAVEDRGKQSDVPIYASHPLFREDKARFFVDPWPWMEHLSGRKFAFGTRIHGNITALISGTPCYVFAHDSRTLELVRYFDIPYRAMKDVPPDVDAAQLYEEADYTQLNNGHKARFNRMVEFLDKHNLANSFADADSASRFEEQVRATRFPAGVRAVSGADALALADRLRWLKESNDELRQTVRGLGGKRLPEQVRRALGSGARRLLRR